MKKTQAVSAGIAFVLAITFSSHAQTTTISIQSLHSASADGLAVMWQAIEATTPLPAESVPRGATIWSAQNINFPPLPSNINNLPAWDLGGGNWLLADQDFDYAALEQQNAAMHMLSKAMGLEMDNQEVAGSSYTIDTNGLWLEIAGVSNGAAWFNLHNSTSQVYAVWSTTDLLAGWNVAAEVWPTNAEVMPFTVPTLERQSLFLRAEDWTGVDSNGDGIPNWWIWRYFGTLDLSATNLDSQGNTLLYDYTNNIDPNVIQFSLQFTNYYVNTLNAPVQLNILGGVPSYMAVLVNDTNQADAVWQPYTSSNIVATLGSTNGTYIVSVGLRGLPPDATQTWQWASVTLYSDAPMLTITNPTTSMVSQSPIQLQGYASQPLDSLSFDVSNAAGVFTNQTGFLTGQFYDTNLLAYTTNYFECSGIVLNSGTNIITLHATDWAGNTTNVSFTLDYSANTNPPVLTVVWPQDGTAISGDHFTLQAQVSDPTATVTASINGNEVQGLVEQNGSVWVQNLSLNAGTNAVTLTASNAFGGVSVTNFNVIGNDVGLVINPLTSDQLNQSSVNVTGFIGDPIDDCVVVNGVQATVYDDGSWEADGVPVNPTGTASLYVQVYVGDPVLIASQMANQPQPATVVLSGYSGFVNTHGFSSPYNLPYLNVYTINWAYDSGGIETDTGYTPADEQYRENPINGSGSLSADGPGFVTPGFGFPLYWDYFSVNTSYLSEGDEGDTVYFQRSSKTSVMIAPSGQEPAGATNIYLVLACASEYSDPVQHFGYGPGDVPLPPEWLQIKGQILVNTGITNTDGSVWGAALVSALAGATPNVTPTIKQFYYNKAATFNVQVTNLMKIVDANSGQDLTTQTNTVIVGQQMNLQCQLNITNFIATNFQWTVPGFAISNYVVAADASSAVVYTNFPTTNSNVIFYWVDGASNRVVQCSATVQGKTITGQAMFNIYRPSVTFTDSPPSWATNDIVDGTLSLVLGAGDGGNGQGSMSYRIDVSSAYLGRVDYTQLIKRSAANGNTSDNTSGQYWMDNTRFYMSQNNNGGFPISTNSAYSLSFNDGPSFALAHSIFNSTTSIFDQFEDYIIFRPKIGNENNNIYVPIGKITWSWSAATTYSGGAWSTPTYSITRPSTPDGSNEFPQWPQTYKNN